MFTVSSLSHTYHKSIDLYDGELIHAIIRHTNSRIPTFNPHDFVQTIQFIGDFNPKVLIHIDKDRIKQNKQYYEKPINQQHLDHILANNSNEERIKESINYIKNAISFFRELTRTENTNTVEPYD